VAAIAATGYGADDMLSTSGGVMTGNLSLQGTPNPLTIPANATEGYVWTCPDTEGDGTWQAAPGASSMSNPMTTAGDLIDGGSGGTPQRVAIGSSGQVLTVSAGAPAWETLPGATSGAEGVVKLAGDLSGSASAPTVAKLQGVAIAAPDEDTAHYLNGAGAWTTPAGGGGLGGVTVSGTPAEGQALIATSSSAATWEGVFGTRPEMFGTIGGTTDGAIINAAIAAVNAGSAPGPVVLTGVYSIEETITVLPGVNLWGSGQGNRGGGIFPDTFTGGYIRPSTSFPTNTPLITIGSTATTSAGAAANPCGASLIGVCLSGLTSADVNVADCVGVLVTDTADVHLIDCFLANFDRPGGTGTCVKLTSADAGNGYGFCATNCIFSASYQGVYGDGAGVTDMRYQGNLWHSCTQMLTLGPTAGGGGAQITNDHFTYTGSPSGSYGISLGSQAGDFMISNVYVDKFGSGVVPVQLATAKGIMNGVHFLSSSTNTAASLVSLSTASQEIVFSNCQVNANSSALVSLLQLTSSGIGTTSPTGGPAGGVYANNLAFGTTGSFAGLFTNYTGAAIGNNTYTSGSSTASVTGNVVSS
jgi:Repeat of unknown function (DUF5907)